jgi:hypothetical protein
LTSTQISRVDREICPADETIIVAAAKDRFGDATGGAGVIKLVTGHKNSPFGLLALIRFNASTYWDQQLERK